MKQLAETQRDSLLEIVRHVRGRHFRKFATSVADPHLSSPHPQKRLTDSLSERAGITSKPGNFQRRKEGEESHPAPRSRSKTPILATKSYYRPKLREV